MKNLILFPILLLLSNVTLALTSQQIEIIEPYARAVTAAQTNSAVFMQLKNNTNTNFKIVNAKSNVSSVVELHTHINDNGVMRMRRIPVIELPAQSTVDLKPGGLHIMLINLYEALAVGTIVELEIEFEDGSKSIIDAPVKKVMGMMHHKKMNKKAKHGKSYAATNPMPNLMQVIKKHGHKLELTDQQKGVITEFGVWNS